MRFSVLANAAFASLALAIPSPNSADIAPRQEGACLTRAEAKEMVDVYVQLIANYTDEVCTKYCASDFVDRSDSINTFIFRPLGEPTFATKEIFMAAQNANPPFPVVVDSIDAVDCEAIALRWHATFGAANLPSKGITIIGTTKREGYAQIKSLDVEFNSLIWLLNMGGNYTSPHRKKVMFGFAIGKDERRRTAAHQRGFLYLGKGREGYTHLRI